VTDTRVGLDQPPGGRLHRARVHRVQAREDVDLACDTGTGWRITIHSTPSLHGGVVSEPM
jgi:hypothetical protein